MCGSAPPTSTVPGMRGCSGPSITRETTPTTLSAVLTTSVTRPANGILILHPVSRSKCIKSDAPKTLKISVIYIITIRFWRKIQKHLHSSPRFCFFVFCSEISKLLV